MTVQLYVRPKLCVLWQDVSLSCWKIARQCKKKKMSFFGTAPQARTSTVILGNHVVSTTNCTWYWHFWDFLKTLLTASWYIKSSFVIGEINWKQTECTWAYKYKYKNINAELADNSFKVTLSQQTLFYIQMILNKPWQIYLIENRTFKSLEIL